jgi:hypothetical protein
MVSVFCGLSDFATTVHVEPLCFSRYRSKSVPAGLFRHPTWAPEAFDVYEPPFGWYTLWFEVSEPL